MRINSVSSLPVHPVLSIRHQKFAFHANKSRHSPLCSVRNWPWRDWPAQSIVWGADEMEPVHWEVHTSPRLGSDSTAHLPVQFSQLFAFA